MAGAFEGVRVLDLTQGIGGPVASMLLGDHGATVLRCEPPGGDRARSDPGYLCWSRNKQRIELDPERPAERARLEAWLAAADVVMFDCDPGELERLGLDADRLCARHPSLVHVWMPPYGTDARWRGLEPSELLLAGVSGVAFSQFSQDDVPVQLVTPQLGYAHGMIGAVAIAAALYERARSGRGQGVTVTGFHAVAAVRGGTAARVGHYVRGTPRGTRGSSPSYRLYRCGDGRWLFLGTLLVHHFERALRALDVEELLAWPGVEGRAAALRGRELAARAHARLEARFAEKACDDWLEILRRHDVPRAAVGDRDAWFASDAVAAIDMRVRLPHAELGEVDLPGVSARLSATPGAVRALVEPVPDTWTWPERGDTAVAHAPTRDTAASPGAAVAGPLAGVRVVDLGAILATPFGTSILAQLGADVIKLEPPSGDGFRATGIGFTGYNQGKRGLVLDLRRPGGRAAFHELARRVDVVCDNYRLGVLERLGIDWDTLSRHNPRLIQASVTGYGATGPLAELPGFDPLLQAQSGMMAAQGGGDEPVFHQIAINDMASGMVLAFGVVAALYARERIGRGQRVETSLAHQSVLCQSGELTRYAGRPPAPTGGRDWPGPSSLERFYRCADGWIALATRTERLPALERALGAADGTPAPELGGLSDPERAETIGARLAQLDRDAWLRALRAHGIAAAPVHTFVEILESPGTLDPELFQDLEHPSFGPLRTVRRYAELRRTPCGFTRAAPELGAHGDEILRELGFEASRIEALARSGTLGRPGAGSRSS